MIRNIYNLGLTNIDGSSLEIDIEDNLRPRLNPQYAGELRRALPADLRPGPDRPFRRRPARRAHRLDLRARQLGCGAAAVPDHRSVRPRYHASGSSGPTAGSSSPGSSRSSTTPRRRSTKRSSSPTREQEVHQYIIQVRAVSTSKTFRINALNIVEQQRDHHARRCEAPARTATTTSTTSTGEVTLKESALSRAHAERANHHRLPVQAAGRGGSEHAGGHRARCRSSAKTRASAPPCSTSRAPPATTAPRLGEEPTRAVVGGITRRLPAPVAPPDRPREPAAVRRQRRAQHDQPSTAKSRPAFPIRTPRTRRTSTTSKGSRTPIASRSRGARGTRPACRSTTDNTVKPTDSRVDFYLVQHRAGARRPPPRLEPRRSTSRRTRSCSRSTSTWQARRTVDDTTQYAGIMLGFQGGGLDISQGQFLEIWVNDFKPDPFTRGGKLRIDLGIIDENFHDMDVSTFDDEDKDRDGFAATFDDTGLDGLVRRGRDRVAAGRNRRRQVRRRPRSLHVSTGATARSTEPKPTSSTTPKTWTATDSSAA